MFITTKKKYKLRKLSRNRITSDTSKYILYIIYRKCFVDVDIKICARYF